MNSSARQKLGTIQCFLLDMDGTVYLGDQLLPGAREFIDYLLEKSIPFLFISNNSSKNELVYQRKLNKLGLKVTIDHIFTSGQATADYINEKYRDSKVFLLGTRSLKATFIEKGIDLQDKDPGIAVLGFDISFTYKELWYFCDLIRKGLPYIATHPDFNCPIDTGFMPDIGATIEFIAASTGRRPDIIIGKPHSPMVSAIVKRTGIPMQQMAMIGDRLYTDIAMGALGMTTILVLSGETSKEDLKGSAFRPDLIYENLAGLLLDIREIRK